MSALSIQVPFPVFQDRDGQPLDNGYIWIGTANLNPITNPIAVYWDAALSAPATQPIRTLGGYPSNSGTPSRLYVSSNYSIQVLDRKGSMVYSSPVATERYGGGIINANIVVYDPAGTGAVATTVQAKLREGVSATDNGATGNGSTDDTVNFQSVVATAPSVLDLVGKTYRITAKLIFSVAGMTIRNGTLLFDGPITDRLLNVTASNVTFENIIFDGNSKQPRSALAYVDTGIDRPKFLNCTFKNLSCVNNGSTVLNQTYALLINPYSVTNFEVSGCLFKDLLKYNDGVNGTPTATATVGLGFIGGVCFLPEDFSEPTAAPTTITSGIINGCTFDNIQTVKAAGLSIANQADFDDADAIRTYGVTGGVTTINLHVSDCIFRNVSKRAFKLRASGANVHDCEVYADGMQYGMIVPIDVTNNSKVQNVKVYASSSKPVQSGVQWSIGFDGAQRETLIQGLYVSHAIAGVGWFSDGATPLAGLVLRDVFINQASSYGIVGGAPFATTQADIVIENVQIFGSGNVCAGVNIAAAIDGTCGIRMKNVYIANGSFSVAGNDSVIRDVEVEITSNTYAGTGTSDYLFLINGGTGSGRTNVNNFFVNAWNISNTYVNATRTLLGAFIGVGASWRNISIKVPEGISTTYEHCEFCGSNWELNGYHYNGLGRTFICTTVAGTRWAVRNAYRMNSNSATSTAAAFLYTNNASTGNGLFENITDFCTATGNTITVGNGLGAGSRFIATNVASKTSGTIVQNGGLATVVNAINFP